MKTYRCGNCGFHVQRPSQPYRCPQCGAQAVGLFKVVPNGSSPVPPAPLGVQPSPPPAPPSVATREAMPPLQPVRPTVPSYQASPPPPPPAVPSPLPPPAAPQAAASPPPVIRPASSPARASAPTPAAPPAVPAADAQPAPAQTRRVEKTPDAQAAPPSRPQPAARPPQARPQPTRPERPSPSGAKPKTRTSPPVASTTSRPSGTSAKTESAKPETPKAAPRVRPQPVRPQEFAWAYPEVPPFEDEARPMRNAPAVDSQGRLILYTQGRLVARVEEEGKAKVAWEYVTGSHVPGRVVVAADDTVRIHTSDGFLHCVTPAGRQLWSPAQVGEPLGWAAPVVDGSGNTWLSAYEGGLLRVSPEGKPDRHPYFRTRSKLDSAAIIHGGVLYVGSEDGYVLAIPLGADKGVNQWNQATEQGYTGGYVNSSPAIAPDGTLVVAARDERLWGFSPSGTVAWCAEVPGQILGSPVIDRYGHVYAGVSQAERGQTPNGSLISVDGNSHKIRWQYAAAGPVESTPVIGGDDAIYFGDNAGTIHALDSRGKAQWIAKVESPVRSAGTVPDAERVALGLDDDTLVVLRCSSKGLCEGGWPKIAGTLGQSGLIHGERGG